jgi:hypothetical protein
MTTTITDASSSITPDLVMEYSTERESRNVLHNVIGKAEQDVSLELDGLRYGTLHLFFQSKTDAWVAYDALGGVGTWELNDTDHPQIDMNFVRQGSMQMKLDPVSRQRWIIEMDYQEVL